MEKREDLITLRREGYQEQNFTGEAYAFFDTPEPINAKDLRPESSDLTLIFAKGEEQFLEGVGASKGLRDAVAASRTRVIFSSDDPRSKQERNRVSEGLETKEFDYGLRIVYGQNNTEAADQLARVMGYVNGRFIERDDPFRAAVVYQNDRGEYVPRN